MRLVLILSMFIIASGPGFAATIYVPDQYPAIQGAINASSNGDTIIVRTGTYPENIDFKGKAILLKSETSPDGTVIDGRYRLVKLLGQGGMGEVYAADHVRITKKVAVKVLHPEISTHAEAVARFEQEAKSASDIRHDNIVAIDDFGQTPDGRKIFSLADVYQKADLVTYPSTVEGFGNAFLETIYYCRPIVMSAYEIYRRDIQPKGFKVIGFQDFITQDCVRHARDVLRDPDLAAEMADHNYKLGRRHYSYRTLEKRLVALISECLGD